MHGCARTQANGVWCWGYNGKGQLGDDSTSNRNTPVRVQNSNDFVDIAAGHHSTCARKGNGTVWCWGWNNYWQLGDGSQVNRRTPVQMLAVNNAIAISLPGFSKTCVLRSNRTVWCLGRNEQGQLGDGTEQHRPVLTQVRDLSNVMYLGQGPTGYSMMAVTMDGLTYAWGEGNNGVLGLGDENNYFTPQRIQGF